MLCFKFQKKKKKKLEATKSKKTAIFPTFTLLSKYFSQIVFALACVVTK
ncbi:hypothetical protein Hdeb2414_s0028g00699581 [Helianthus debilis subsp. tardiflorus]